MITPKFTISQDDEYLYVKIFISSIRFNASGLELVIDGPLFVFHLSPYYLRLRFSADLVEDEVLNNVDYDSKEDCINCKILKAEKGTEFQDLDLHSKLLAGKYEEPSKGPLIQELDIDVENIDTIREEGQSLDWEIKQKVFEEEGPVDKYGFDRQYNGYIGVSLPNGNDINELEDPEHTGPEDRVKERIGKENLKFDPEYYAAEYMTYKYGDEEELEINGIKRLLEYVPPLSKEFLHWYKRASDEEKATSSCPVEFTEKEQQQMQDYIPKKSYLIQDIRTPYLTILSLLYSYTFEQIENEGQHTTESPWTIGKLTPQIAMLDQQILPAETAGEFSQIKGIIVTAMRRSLSYPLHRNYDLCIKASLGEYNTYPQWR